MVKKWQHFTMQASCNVFSFYQSQSVAWAKHHWCWITCYFLVFLHLRICFNYFLSLMFISFTMLNTAAKGHKECVELLLNNKASLNGKDKVTFVHAVNLLIRTSWMECWITYLRKIVNYLPQLPFIVFKSILQKVRDVF